MSKKILVNHDNVDVPGKRADEDLFATVDDEFYEYINQYEWFAVVDPHGKTCANTLLEGPNGELEVISMEWMVICIDKAVKDEKRRKLLAEQRINNKRWKKK